MATESTESTEKHEVKNRNGHGITRKNKSKNEKSKKEINPVVSLCGDHNHYQFAPHTLLKKY
jgi:hypothetical protein